MNITSIQDYFKHPRIIENFDRNQLDALVDQINHLVQTQFQNVDLTKETFENRCEALQGRVNAFNHSIDTHFLWGLIEKILRILPFVTYTLKCTKEIDPNLSTQYSTLIDQEEAEADRIRQEQAEAEAERLRQEQAEAEADRIRYELEVQSEEDRLRQEHAEVEAERLRQEQDQVLDVLSQGQIVTSNRFDLDRLEMWINRSSERKERIEKFSGLFTCFGNPPEYTLNDRAALLGLLPIESRSLVERTDPLLPNMLRSVESLKNADLSQLKAFIKLVDTKLNVYSLPDDSKRLKVAVQVFKDALEQNKVPTTLLPEFRELILKEISWLKGEVSFEVKYQEVFQEFLDKRNNK